MSLPEVVFTGKPQEIDNVAADAQFQFILNASDYSTEPEKIAYFFSKCRGPALTWGARYLDSNPGLESTDYATFLAVVKTQFGYNNSQAGAIARAQLSSMTQTGTLVEFLSDFDDACGRADIHADESKITMILGKLKPRYSQIIIQSGVIPVSYPSLRMKLLNISAMEGQATHLETVQKQGRPRRKNKRDGAGPRIKNEAKN